VILRRISLPESELPKKEKWYWQDQTGSAHKGRCRRAFSHRSIHLPKGTSMVFLTHTQEIPKKKKRRQASTILKRRALYATTFVTKLTRRNSTCLPLPHHHRGSVHFPYAADGQNETQILPNKTE